MGIFLGGGGIWDSGGVKLGGSSASINWHQCNSLSELCVPVSMHPGRSHLRSAAIGDLATFVPPTRTKTIGPHGFFSSGPSAWNKLPTDMKDGTLSLNCFKERLKTFLFV